MRLAVGGLRFYAPMFLSQWAAWSAMFLLWVFALPHIRAALHSNDPHALQIMGIGLAMMAAGGAMLNLLQLRFLKAGNDALKHSLALTIASIGLHFIAIARGEAVLLSGYAGVTIGWASLSSTPYRLVSARVTDGNYDRAMARFNFSVALPQLLIALLLGWSTQQLSPQQAIIYGSWFMLAGGAFALVLIRSGYRFAQ